VLIKDLLTLFS